MTVQFYADPAAAGANDGTSWTDAWTTFGAAMTGMAAYNAGTMADAYVLNCRGHFSQAVRFNTGTSFVGNSSTNTITIDGGTWDGIRGTENTFFENTGLDEAILIQEDFVRLVNLRCKTAGTAAADTAPRLLGNLTYFYSEKCLYENPPSIGTATGGSTRIFNDCIWDIAAGANINGSMTGSLGNIVTTSFYNCIANFMRLTCGNYSTTNWINSIYMTSTAISKAATSCVINGDYSSFWANEAATLDSSVGAVMSTGNLRATDWTDEVNGDLTNTAAGLITWGGLGIGPSADANVPSPAFNGNARSGATCDIGPYEQASGPGGLSIPIAAYHYNHHLRH